MEITKLRLALLAIGFAFGFFIGNQSNDSFLKTKNRPKLAPQVANQQVYLVKTLYSNGEKIDWQGDDIDNDIYNVVEFKPNYTLYELYEAYLNSETMATKVSPKDFENKINGLIKKGQILKVKWVVE